MACSVGLDSPAKGNCCGLFFLGGWIALSKVVAVTGSVGLDSLVKSLAWSGFTICIASGPKLFNLCPPKGVALKGSMVVLSWKAL